MTNALLSITRSWACRESSLNSLEDLLEWIKSRNDSLKVRIERSVLSGNSFWFYNASEGCIANKNNSFFTITGIRQGETEHPIIVQNEIGFLGIICKEFEGVMHFLMQAKIEPGNVNKIQLSPTIQATKSNFTQKHGGKKPAYLDYFLDAGKYELVVDQIQSEQASRFYKKRNRNIIIHVREEIETLSSHKWMTLGQIKALMKYDNIVNMDTRTVLSCIPFSYIQDGLAEIRPLLRNAPLYRSLFEGDGNNPLPGIYRFINDYKMIEYAEPKLVPLHSLKSWSMDDSGVFCNYPFDFRVIYCDVAIEEREVSKWFQPLFEACGFATFGLFVRNHNGVTQFLVRAKKEIGCMDSAELGPTLQLEPSASHAELDDVERFFLRKRKDGDGVLYDVTLSEEGGRFYQEQNYNVIIEIGNNELDSLPAGYFWVSYKTLNQLVQINNCLNIQLRNLLSLLEV